jgi:hypothetical protein
MFDWDDESMIFRPGNIGGNKGFPPYLLTTATVFKYAIDTTTISSAAISHASLSNTVSLTARKVKQILVDVTNVSYIDDQFYGERIIESFMNPYSPYGVPSDRMTFAEVKVSKTNAMIANSGDYIRPTITFQADPGSSTEKYFIYFYVGAPRLTTAATEIPLPIRFSTAMEDYIRGRVQELESGNPSNMTKKFYDYWIPEFHAHMRGGATTARTATPPNYT